MNDSSFSLGLKLPGGNSAGWTAADAGAVPALQMLQNCSGLTAAESPCTWQCQVRRFAGVVPAGSFQLGWQGVRVTLAADGQADVLTYPWELAKPERRGLIVRQLFFLGVLPAMLRGNTFLVHGVLAERGGRGVIFCGPSGIGKSTTASRLTADFQVLSDDCMLLTHCDGRFWVQPVPTWSIWICGKPEQRFDCRKILELEAFYLLERGEHGVLELTGREKMLGLTPSFTDMMRWHTTHYPAELAKKLAELAMAGAAEVAAAIPGRRFRVKLDATKVGGIL